MTEARRNQNRAPYSGRTRWRLGFSLLLRAICILVVFPSLSFARSESAREMLREGNRLYGRNKHTEAINKYNEALVAQPNAIEPKFNKANSYYRLDDLGEAIDLYQEAAAESKDMAMVARARYNLGNCFFQRGARQRDSDLQKAVEDMKTSITYWRQVLDINPKNEKAARNIEVARLTIKDILDQLKKQQEQQKNQQGQRDSKDQQKQQQAQQDPNQPQDPNQVRQANQPQDPNQGQDPNQAQAAQQQPDPNQAQQEQQPEGGQQDRQQEQKMMPDATAQEIIDAEQREKKEREIRQRIQYREVDKDW